MICELCVVRALSERPYGVDRYRYLINSFRTASIRARISYCMWSFAKAVEACSAIRSTVPKYSGFTREDYTETGLWLLDTLKKHP